MPDPNTISGRLERALLDSGDRPAIYYFNRTISFGQLHQQSEAFAIALQNEGVRPGDRVMICLQNVPEFIVAMVAASKLGAIAVPVNPMYRERELSTLLRDCTPMAFIGHDHCFDEVLSRVDIRPPLRYAVSPGEGVGILPPVISESEALSRTSSALRFSEAVTANIGARLQGEKSIRGDDVAMLVYTSGTTGQPKGAIIRHRNICAGGDFYFTAARLSTHTPILGVAPLFHVTGLSGHIVAALTAVAPLILCYRFQPEAVLDAIERHRPAFVVAAITALAALIDHPRFAPERFQSFSSVFSGGAPIAPALYERFREKTGLCIRNVYGLTETTAPITAVSQNVSTPIDPESGALSVGRAVPGATIAIVNDFGVEAGPGERGELIVKGPSVVSGYWNNETATAASMRPEGFYTGDVGVRDTEGWIYLVDRKKDMIVASGFKVWPREVEDVLYTHPSVREAAVIGVADAYRGETVKAFVSLHPSSQATPEELITFCKERMAAYKYPRCVEIVDELPKTITGKILRRMLRG